MKTILKFLTFDWLSDYIMDSLNKLERKGSIGKICSYFLVLLGLFISTCGLAGIFGLNYGFVEFIGIYDGVLKVLGVFILPLVVWYLLHQKTWFWVINFIVGILTIIVFINKA